MTALDSFTEDFPFPTDGDKSEKDEWYQELAMYQLGWNTRTREVNALLTLARELIAALTHYGNMSPRMMPPETRGLWERWQAEEMKKDVNPS